MPTSIQDRAVGKNRILNPVAVLSSLFDIEVELSVVVPGGSPIVVGTGVTWSIETGVGVGAFTYGRAVVGSYGRYGLAVAGA